MVVLALVLLALAVAGAVVRPFGLASWVAPVAAAAVELGIGMVALGKAATALSPLAPALGFLLAAVPLAVLLDGMGFFESLAMLMSRGRHMVGWLWVLAAVVTTVLNLDASVVLLTPLYVRVARRSGLAPLTLAFQPVLLAMLASSALPVSNLTNLIAVGRTGASPLQFLVHLGPPSLVASALGYWLYRRALKPGAPTLAQAMPPERRPLVAGGGVVSAVLVGFVLGPTYGVEPWMVALGADVVLLGMAGSAGPRSSPSAQPGLALPGLAQRAWRGLATVPLGTAVLAAALGVLAYALSSALPVAQYLRGSGPGALARTIGLAALVANGANNLPTLLVATPALPAHASPQLWAVLLGVNMGPVVLATGALASLLWLDTLRRLDVQVSALDFSRTGAKVGLPALVVATGVLIGLASLVGA